MSACVSVSISSLPPTPAESGRIIRARLRFGNP